MLLKYFLIKLLIFLHVLILFFMIFGFLLPSKYLIIYVLCWPSIYLHWQLNNNNCYLTELQYKLENKPLPSSKENNYPFVKGVLNNIGIKMNDNNIHIFFMYGITSLWFIGFIRFLFYIFT